MEFVARQFRFHFPRHPVVMGIVNVTPDSFSDGGSYLDVDRAVEQAERLVGEGAEIVDIGGESTRPGAAPVPEEEELRRVLPVLRRLAGRLAVPLSIDTRKPAVARAAIEAGASIMNDVEASREDPGMWKVVAESGAGYVAMHMQGTPETMQAAPHYGDVVDAVSSFFGDRLRGLEAQGVTPAQVLLDPGIGFGKTPRHTLELFQGLPGLMIHRRPLLVGISRKSFLGKLLGSGVSERLPAALACTLWAATRGVGFFRTHDVAATVQALRMAELLGAPLR
jgi:dihydropteroate synthase